MKLNSTNILLGLGLVMATVAIVKAKKARAATAAKPGEVNTVQGQWWNYAGGWTQAIS